MQSEKKKLKPADALLYVVLYAALVFCALITLVPFAYLFCASLKPSEIFFENLFLPSGDGFLGVGWDKMNLDHYRRLFVEESFLRPILNSTFFASVTGVLATLFAATSGYALAKFQFRGRDSITKLVLAALVVPGALLLAPVYQMLYWFGMLDSYAGLIIPGLAPAFGVYLFRQATVNSVPNELLESARIDGCGEIKIFFTFVLPLIRPMMGAFLLLTFLGCWNNFIGAQIVLQTPEKMPLAVAINQLRGVYGTDYGLIMAGTVISILPVLALFLLLQKEFLSGLTSGAVKG
jgi:ABC-type glycerol-3-phosphate transport system permease component